MFGRKLKELREKRGLSQRELAKILSISPSSIAMYELNQRSPDKEMITFMSTFFNVSSDYLLGISDNPVPYKNENVEISEKLHEEKSISFIGETKEIPIYSLGNTGEKVLAQENIIGWQAVPAELMENHVAFLIIDDSMSGSRIYPNDCIIVNQQSQAEDGQIVVVEHDNKVLVRRIKYANNGIILYPDNSNYLPLLINSNEISILGVVVQVIFDVK